MANTAVPTLDTAGWVTDGAEKLNRLLAYFFTTMNSQSNLYRSTINSIQSIIEKSGNDIDDLTSSLQRQLSIYLGRYYDNVTIKVYIDPATIIHSLVTLNLDIAISDKDGFTKYGPSINLNNGVFKSIVDLTA
jgi:hypothetical protein